jgi:hypothetical protein
MSKQGKRWIEVAQPDAMSWAMGWINFWAEFWPKDHTPFTARTFPG